MTKKMIVPGIATAVVLCASGPCWTAIGVRDKTKRTFPEALSRRQKAVRFGLIYWLLSVCGMPMTYSSFPVSLLMVGSWTLSVLVEGMIASLILSKLNS